MSHLDASHIRLRNGRYYLKYRAGGKEHSPSLKTSSEKVALKRAKLKIAEIDALAFLPPEARAELQGKPAPKPAKRSGPFQPPIRQRS